MRRIIWALALAMSATRVGAQQPDTVAGRGALPQNIANEVMRRWEAAGGVRGSGPVTIEAGREVSGDVAVRGGTVTIGGRIQGHVTALDADVVLQPGARVDGDLWVIGGALSGREGARIDGEIRIYRERVEYRMDGDLIVVRGATRDEPRDSWWQRRRQTVNGSADALRIAHAGAYNRAEGLPIKLGPALQQRYPWGSVRIDASAVVRTASTFDDGHGDVGHDVGAEVRFGQVSGVGIGGQLFNTVAPVESWQMSNLESSLASFLFHRDYRDYYERHGGRGTMTLFSGDDLSLTGGLGEERWSARELFDPWTLFRNGAAWRPNPLMDEGRFRIGTLQASFDSRTDPDDPWSGWYVTADWERGTGTLTAVGATSTPRTVAEGDRVTYQRGFLDVRRYNRLSPIGQLNFRVLLGGWMGGDELPLQRRLSVDGPGTLPGFGFRQERTGLDVGTCTAPGGPSFGRPAECERIALAQVEYRGDFSVRLGDPWESDSRHFIGIRRDWSWVVFADMGRGWSMHDPTGAFQISGALPKLSTFRSDLGAGIDMGGLGVYAAKAVSVSGEPVNFFVRLRRRF